LARPPAPSAALPSPRATFAFNFDPSAFRILEELNVTAEVSYAVPSGNCSSYDFSQYLQYSWNVTSPSGTKLTMGSGKSLVLASNWFSGMLGTYNISVTVTGLTDPATSNYPSSTGSTLLTAVDLKPVATLSVPTTISLSESFTVTASVAYPLSAANFSWACFSGSGGNTVLCPALPAANSTTFVYPANPTGPAGSVMVVVYYWYAATTLDLAYVAGSYQAANVTIDLSAAATPAPSTPAPTLSGCVQSSPNERLLFDNVPLSCLQPFDCFADFCLCVNGTVTATCTPFGTSINASTIESCTARRVSCIIRAALDANTVWGESCQQWGASVAELYSAYYADRSSTNLTDVCVAEACSLVTAGSNALAAVVNYSRICDVDVDQIGAPLPSDEVAGCVAPARAHFDDVPVQCGAASNCSKAYCVCLGGSWSAATTSCNLPAAQPLDDVFDACLATYISCLTNVR
jgi:hypothetical protein